MNKLNGTHLTKHDRVKIQELLASKTSCKDIALEIGKDDRTISKEIKKRRSKEANGKSKFNVTSTSVGKTCKKLDRFPFVCNACLQRRYCTHDYKCFYRALEAHENYEHILRDSRSGIDMELADKIHLDKLLQEGVQKGQSIQHIVANHPDEINCSVRSVYRFINANQTIIQNIDLRRKVKLKPRHHTNETRSINLKVIEGRTYADFLMYYGMNPTIGIVEIDTVEGIKGKDEKCLLTIHFTAFHFMLSFLLEHKSKECVSLIFRYLQSLLGGECFKALFPIILTDRGSEFFDPLAIEFDIITGEQLSHVFFCDSYSSYQKGSIEENHVLLRYIIPKGISMQFLTQEKVELMISHINSYFRKSIQSDPYRLMCAFYGNDLMDKLKVKAINPDFVTLKPTLLK